MHKIFKSLGPIIISALSIFIAFLIIQPIACWLDPTFNLLANRGVGKIALTTLVILHIVLLVFTQSKSFLKLWVTKNLSFLRNSRWLKYFFLFFVIFFALHALMLISTLFLGVTNYNYALATIKTSIYARILFGFIVTFFLAWTEELIFRGTIYLFLVQNIRKFESVILTSFIFMLVHDLANPINLVTKNWKLGLGLFLLGILLNLIFEITGKLYTGMGAHAGLVFVKVILRRIPFITYLPAQLAPWWFARDLRQAHSTHIAFIIVNIMLVIAYRKKLFNTNSNTKNVKNTRQ